MASQKFCQAVKFSNFIKLSNIIGLRSAFTCQTVSNKFQQRSYSTDEAEDDPDTVELELEKEKKFEELSIEKLRDVSGLPPHYANLLEHRKKVPEPSPNFFMNRTNKYKRNLYATYGKESGVDPGIMWPSKKELEDLKLEEKEWEPTFSQMLREIKLQRKAEAEEKRIKLEHVEKQMAKMPKLIERYKASREKLEQAEQARLAKRQQYIEAARDEFGFYPNRKSEKFKEFVQNRKEEERKERKELKKSKNVAKA